MLRYRDELINRYLVYKQRIFTGAEAYFDLHYSKPPVFLPSEAWRNLITNPQATTGERQQLLHLLPPPERHRWFRSMNSSQALAQSLLGNLAVHQQLHWLTDLVADDGTLLLGKAHLSLANFSMEYTFVQTNPGMGPGPYQFRVTDGYGNVLIDSGITPIENGTVDGAAQFPVGP